MSLVARVVAASDVVWLTVFLFGAGFTGDAASGGEATAGVSPQAGLVQTAELEYGEAGYEVINRSVPVANRSAAFPKEPAFKSGKVFRGDFQLPGGTNSSVSFAWDPAAGKLYLDLNRNHDLTDDPAGIFACREKGYSNFYQTFTNVHLSGNTLAGRRNTLVDLNLYQYASGLHCSAAVHSFWQGKMTLQGQEWQAGVVENPSGQSVTVGNGYLLLRPWAARNEPFNTDSSSSVTFSFPGKFFFRNQAYRLDCTGEAPGESAKLTLRFTGEQPALGKLNITGDFIQRLVLQNGPYLVVLDQPESVASVPVGRYSRPGVWLKKGDAEAYRDSSSSRSDKWITVDEEKPAVLAVGGPLTNSVSINRQGKYLRLNYELLGAGGEAYQLAQADRSRPPEFAVYQGDRKIASGKFAYG